MKTDFQLEKIVHWPYFNNTDATDEIGAILRSKLRFQIKLEDLR